MVTTAPKPTTTKATKITHKWAAWSLWSDCSASCGDGERSRFRLCDEAGDLKSISDKNSPLSCKGNMYDIEQCEQMECAPEATATTGNCAILVDAATTIFCL